MVGVSLLVAVLTAVPGARGPSPAAPSPVAGEAAPWARLVVPRCEAALKDAGVKRVHFLRPHRVRSLKKRAAETLYCHVPQRMRYVRGPGRIRYSGFVVVNCAMALALARFETIVQETARRVFGPKHTVKHIFDYGTYNCRRIRGYDMLSEHAYGNAIDIARFRVRGYGVVSVLEHWNSRRKRHRKRREFLHSLVAELRRQKVFSTILDPDYNYAHRNHLHLDLRRVRWGVDGYRATADDEREQQRPEQRGKRHGDVGGGQ